MSRSGIVLEPEERIWEVLHLPALVKRWISVCHERTDRIVEATGEIDTSTADGYEDKVNYFVRWVQALGPFADWELREENLLAFRQWLEDSDLSYNTRKDVHRRLRSMLKWAREKGHCDFDFRSWVPPARGSAPGRQAASIEMLEKLMEATLATEHPIRNMAILAVLMGTGVRREECAYLNVEDLNFAPDLSGSIWVRQAKVVKGREVQQRLVAFDDATGAYLAAWLECYAVPAGPLFPALRGRYERLSAQGIYKLVKSLIRRAGLEDRIQGPHDLRRAFSTHFERQRRGEGHGRLLSKQLGHARYTQTQQYSLQDVEDVREVIISPMMLMSRRFVKRRDHG